MARVTVEDCVLRVPNRFELVMLAAQRARNISAGAQLTLDRDKDKNPVVALREIADETVDLAVLEDTLIKGLQRHVEIDELPEEEMDVLAIGEQIFADTGEAKPEEEIAEDVLSIQDDDVAADMAGEIMPEAEDEPADPEFPED